MYYVYLVKNTRNQKLYYGYTNHLKRRLAEHESDGQWQLVYYEAYQSEQDARTRERKLKHYGQARTYLNKRLQHSLTEQISAGFNSDRQVRSPWRAP